jgi:DnaJ-class molecular chaperone
VYPDWRGEGDEGATDEEPRSRSSSSGAMSRAEALKVLGLEANANDAEIKQAHHRLIAGLHPDRGGSAYLAAKINEARDVLLKG